MELSDTISVKATLDIEHRREYYEHNRRALLFGIAFAVFTSVLGLYLSGWLGCAIGFIFGLAGLWFIPSLKTKVIEKIRSHSE